MANQQQQQNQQFFQPEAFAQLASQVQAQVDSQGAAQMGMQEAPNQALQQQMMMSANAMLPPQLLQAGMMLSTGLVAVASPLQQSLPLLWPNGNKGQGAGDSQAPGAFPLPIPMPQLSSPNMRMDIKLSPLLQSQMSPPTLVPVSETISVSAKTSATNAEKAPRCKVKGTAAAKFSKAPGKKDERHAYGNDKNDDKVEQSRERNREHARSTRLRKKAYIHKLKEMATGLRSMQTAEICQRRISMQKMLDVQAVRRAVVQSFLQYHANYEQDPQKWNLLLEESFWLKEPVTPFRSFRRSEIDRDSRVVRGTEGMICDAASLGLMLERVGCYNARWKRIKRNNYLDEDFLNKEIMIGNAPGSSLSSTSSTGSSGSTSGKPGEAAERKRKNAAGNLQSQQNRVDGTLKSSLSETHSVKRPKVSLTDNHSLVASQAGAFPPTHSITSLSQQHYPFVALSSYNLKLANNKQRTSASYYINEDDMIMIEDVMMCPYMFRTNNAVVCGALADCVIRGMLRIQFSPNNKLLSMEMIFDAMGFMQQLDGANGGNITAQVIPGSLEMALMHCAHEARVITEAKAPFNILHVNEKWTALTEYSQLDVEGRSLLPLVEGREAVGADNACSPPNEKAVKILEQAAKGRPGCDTSVHHGKTGKQFVNFMCSYPLTNTQDKITHLLHVSMELPKGGTFIP